MVHVLRQALSRFFANRQPAGKVMDGHDAGAIHDGIPYALPYVLPRQVEADARAAGTFGKLMESARDTFRFQFDTPQRTAFDLPAQMPTEDPLREWDWSTREYVLTQTHAAYTRNPIANRGVKYTAAFVIGKGFSLDCKHPDVERVLQAFMDDPDNCIRKYERQAVIDLLVDGELILRLYESDGQIVAAPMRPWELQHIVTERGFFRRLRTFHFQRYVTEGDSPFGGQRTEEEDVPADQILFVTINSHAYELRGRPELYAILPWLRAYKEWLENRARLNFWRSALLFHVKVMGGLQQIVSAAARWRKPPAPGTVAVTSDKETIEAIAPGIGAADAGDDGRQIKLMSAVGLGIPEYMLADGYNANLASATAQQMPVLMTFGDLQRVMLEELWYPLFKRVLQAAIDAGELPDEVDELDPQDRAAWENPAGDLPMPDDDADDDSDTPDAAKPAPKKIPTLDAFDVSYQPLQDTDPVNIAQAMDAALRNGLVSKETASTEMGFDWQREQKRMTAEREADINAMAQGLMPMPPGMMPDGTPVPPDEDEGEDADAVPPSAA